jgi:hypothetical protein
LRTQLGHGFLRDGTVFGNDYRRGTVNFTSNLSKDGFLFFKIQTQGLTSFSVTERCPLRLATLTGKSCWGTPSAWGPAKTNRGQKIIAHLPSTGN